MRVNNLWQSDLPPRAGEHLFCGGIYRVVSLIFVPKAHIKWNGIFIKTSLADNSSAEISVEVETKNADGKNIGIQLCNANGRQIFTKEYTATTLTKISFAIDNTSLGEIQGTLAKAGTQKIMVDYVDGKPIDVNIIRINSTWTFRRSKNEKDQWGSEKLTHWSNFVVGQIICSLSYPFLSAKARADLFL